MCAMESGRNGTSNRNRRQWLAADIPYNQQAALLIRMVQGDRKPITKP